MKQLYLLISFSILFVNVLAQRTCEVQVTDEYGLYLQGKIFINHNPPTKFLTDTDTQGRVIIRVRCTPGISIIVKPYGTDLYFQREVPCPGAKTLVVRLKSKKIVSNLSWNLEGETFPNIINNARAAMIFAELRSSLGEVSDSVIFSHQIGLSSIVKAVTNPASLDFPTTEAKEHYRYLLTRLLKTDIPSNSAGWMALDIKTPDKIYRQDIYTICSLLDFQIYQLAGNAWGVSGTTYNSNLQRFDASESLTSSIVAFQSSNNLNSTGTPNVATLGMKGNASINTYRFNELRNPRLFWTSDNNEVISLSRDVFSSENAILPKNTTPLNYILKKLNDDHKRIIRIDLYRTSPNDVALEQSIRRRDAIMKYFTDHGISEDRILATISLDANSVIDRIEINILSGK